jgi:hypothetical protein
MPYPVSVGIQPQVEGRNRMTVFFRLILAIPHAILVGPINGSRAGSSGLLGAAAFFLAIVNWFAIVITGAPIRTIRDFSLFYLRWRTRALAYVALLVDPYPPFGDAPYPVSIEVVDPPEPRNRLTVAFRLILIVPHAIVLAFLLLAWCVTTIVAWFAILFTGTYPAGFMPFGVSVLRWTLRVETYMLLLVDEYPPFSLE